MTGSCTTAKPAIVAADWIICRGDEVVCQTRPASAIAAVTAAVKFTIIDTANRSAWGILVEKPGRSRPRSRAEALDVPGPAGNL
jgi:hypothetical protein